MQWLIRNFARIFRQGQTTDNITTAPKKGMVSGCDIPVTGGREVSIASWMIRNFARMFKQRQTTDRLQLLEHRQEVVNF